MNHWDKLKHCQGCRDDYYNHGNNSTTGNCWMLPTMKMVWKKEAHIDQVPPWKQKAKRLPDCYHKPRHVYVKPNQTF